ncbi:MAG: cadherin-like beta sandwich domain-containing protein [Lachnospiraceae bacterium]|nr:cadherin-like beta sandwich domain-containing protein [Lachnospiraceae bacterium]
MKTGRKILAAVLALLLTVLPAGVLQGDTAKAADVATISASGGTATVGGKVKVTVTVSAPAEIGVVDFTLKYDASALTYTGDSGANGAIREVDTDISGKSKSYSYEFNGNKAGTYTVSVSATRDSVLRWNPVNGSDYFDSVTVKNATVTINTPYKASNNANLGKLSVGEGTLSPAFSKNTTNYTVNVDGAVTALTISAKSEDGKGKVSVSGNKDLKEGANTVTVTCTAEDGKTKKTYTITVNRGPAPTPTPTPTPTPGLIVHVGDSDRTLLGEFQSDLPEGYEPGTVEMDGYTVAVATAADGNTKLVQMDDGRFYVMSAPGQYYLFQRIESPARQFSVIPKPDTAEVPAGWEEDAEQLFGPNVTVYKTEKDPNVALLYLRSPSGEEGWYVYDLKEKSIISFRQAMYEPSPTPMPTSTPTPEPTQPEKPTPNASSDSNLERNTGDNNGNLGEFTTRDYIFGGIMLGLFLLAVLFLVLFLRARNRAAVEEADDYDDDDLYDEDDEMNKTFDPSLLVSEEEEHKENLAQANKAMKEADEAGKKASKSVSELKDALAELLEYNDDDFGN